MRTQLEDLQNLTSNRAKASETLARAQTALKAATALLEDHKPTLDRIAAAFSNALPQIMSDVEKESDKWVTEMHPLFDATKHVEEVAEKAKQTVLARVARWFQEEGNTVLGEAMQQRLALAADRTTELREYVKAVRGRDAIEDGAFLEGLQISAVQAGFGDLATADQSTDAVVGVAIASVIATIVGYIIADIVLFYVLGLISGFLNPFLLAAALVGGVGVWLTMGEDAVRAWIRANVFSKIRDSFVAEDTQKKIRHGLEQPIRDVFHRLASGFRVAAQGVLDEATYQERRVGEELERLSRAGGGRERVAAELLRVESAAKRTAVALAELEAIATSITPAPDDVSGS